MKHEHTHHVAADADKVYAALADIRNLPQYVPQMMAYSNETVKHLEKDPWDGLKFEMPAKYKAGKVPAEDKMTDIVRGRRPMSDLDQVVREWRAEGGDEARQLLATALSNAGR